MNIIYIIVVKIYSLKEIFLFYIYFNYEANK